MIQGWFPEVCAALDKQIRQFQAETRSASEAAAIGSILGRYRIFMKLAEFLGLGGGRGNWAGRGKTRRRCPFASVRAKSR